MIGYITLGTNDLTKSSAFYDTLLAELEMKRGMQSDTFITWSKTGEDAAFSITKPYNGEAASVGNGVMIALMAPSPEGVDKVYAKALELGATDEGQPGPRGGGFYAGYFRDLDGNKLNVFHFNPGA
ncbi:VOC family protein [Woodsholea maritima]|uniref:VOC family protein n=1 Tax=Woodsholea maritima TaxID=240237 RepID=UPI00036296CB|nr:VOC family protein [Woodsholea maritima]